MSELSLMFQDRNNVSQANEHYAPISSFSELVNSTSVAHKINKKIVKSEFGIGIEFAAIDSEIFNSKELPLDDILFLSKTALKYRKKRPLKLR